MNRYEVRSKDSHAHFEHVVQGAHPRIGETVRFTDSGSEWTVVDVTHGIAPDSCGVICSHVVVYVQRDRTEEVP